MSTEIEIPSANLQNIQSYTDEPNDKLVEEIKRHIQQTSKPHTWCGHSHTKPPEGAMVVYVEEFDVPAPDSVSRVAPCPCCSPKHAKYKNKGKIAWFPDESVIRLIGPECFAAFNSEGHKDALVELHRKRKKRTEVAIIQRYTPTIEALIGKIDEALPIANDLDSLMEEINDVVDNQLKLNLWREVKGGNLTISKTDRVSFQRADGGTGEKMESYKEHFATISGYLMFDRSSTKLEKKLNNLRVRLELVQRQLKETVSASALQDTDREKIATILPAVRNEAVEIFSVLLERQRFLTTNTIETLNSWGQHLNAPIQFSIRLKGSRVLLSTADWLTDFHHVQIGRNALTQIPELPEASAR